MSPSQATATKAASATDSAGASLAQTKALAETLAADPDPKVQNSKFLHFLSKMSRGELYIDDNQVRGGQQRPRPRVMCTTRNAMRNGCSAGERAISIRHRSREHRTT